MKCRKKIGIKWTARVSLTCMQSRIEDYAFIGNGGTGALVHRSGSIEWLCFPRFDSGACFAALLGERDNGAWSIRPEQHIERIERRYRPGTLVLETEFTTPQGRMVVVDCMDTQPGSNAVLRSVRGMEGAVRCRGELCARFEHGWAKPSVKKLGDGRFRVSAGAEQLVLSTSAPVEERYGMLISETEVTPGSEIDFSLTWAPSFEKTPKSPAVRESIETVSRDWCVWSSRYKPEGPYGEAVLRSLITLQAMANPETGGIVAAATTSLPEEIGGERNWDYRYCWLRDASFTLYALMQAGFEDEAKAWREWLLRAVGGDPAQMQTLYGVDGRRRLAETEISWLSGYEGSKPVRVGNAASGQLQLDIYGEVLDFLYQAHRTGLKSSTPVWDLEKALANHVAAIWNQPDDGMWEMRGDRRQFTESKVMTWVAMDRAIRSVEEFGHDGPIDEWRKVRDEIHREVCQRGFNSKINSFVQTFESDTLDASLLLMPLVGFLDAADPRIQGTVQAIEKDLMEDGLVRRYNPKKSGDGMKGSEGVFLACSFWLADVYTLQGRQQEARELFERVLSLRNDVGLLSEEYDTTRGRLIGNFPQALSHLALVNTAMNLTAERKPAVHRSSR